MDRETLAYLLKSGKYLCFNPLDTDAPRPDEDNNQSNVKIETESQDADGVIDASEQAPLFDSPHIKDSIFFKEVGTDDRTGRLYTSTRFLMAYNSANPHEGGPSFEISPGQLDKHLLEYFGGNATPLTNHDKCVLEVFERTPTFDPFMLMAQRQYIERFRPVNEQTFYVSASVSTEVRSIIAMKARQLVQLAASAGVNRDKITDTVLAIEEAIWLTQTNEGTSRVFQEMGIPPGQEDEILLAWKGISYYEFMLVEFRMDYIQMLKWLGSGNSVPSTIGVLGGSDATDIHNLRKRAILALRNSYLMASQIMNNYLKAYGTLIERQNPKPFHLFLQNAPTNFEQLGMCVGSFGHVNNAWKDLTNGGHLQKPKSENLEQFYRFVCDLIEFRKSTLTNTE